MREFQIGDKVKWVNTTNYATVTEVIDDRIVVDWSQGSNGFDYLKRFFVHHYLDGYEDFIDKIKDRTVSKRLK